MKHSERLKLFDKVRARYSVFLTRSLWKLTGDREIFTEAMQYCLFEMWRHVEKLDGETAGAYIYRIALSANSKAWRNRVGRNGDIPANLPGSDEKPDRELDRAEAARFVRRQISQLPKKQAKAIVLRYFEQHDYEMIAEKLSCSKAGARSNVSRAMATLRSKLVSMA
ncbi:MAG: sigma-70 family RNA polymerase sigma factor [Sedimentisphaerales bacterium]|nr:sigma-70 family RNA polymerase sigma factor [Sedimentisphaerales bacterium]